jgi:PilZ domain
MTTTESERPTELTETDVTLVTRGITIQATVALSNALALVVRPLAEAHAREVGVKDGDPVELFWNNGFEERMLPAQVSGVDDGRALRWTLTGTGEATKSTRRRAVRADVELPVRVRMNNTEVGGVTADLSEAGMRALLDGYGLPPEPGTSASVDLEVGADLVRVRGTVVRQEERAGRWVVSMRFEDVPEKDQDRLRRRVFQALREERARLAD